jgi:hypothetical protein
MGVSGIGGPRIPTVVPEDINRNTPQTKSMEKRAENLSDWSPKIGGLLEKMSVQQRRDIDTTLDDGIATSFNSEVKTIELELKACFMGVDTAKGEQAMETLASGGRLNGRDQLNLQDYSNGLNEQTTVLRDAAKNYETTVPKLSSYFSARAEAVGARADQVKAALDQL